MNQQQIEKAEARIVKKYGRDPKFLQAFTASLIPIVFSLKEEGINKVTMSFPVPGKEFTVTVALE